MKITMGSEKIKIPLAICEKVATKKAPLKRQKKKKHLIVWCTQSINPRESINEDAMASKIMVRNTG